MRTEEFWAVIERARADGADAAGVAKRVGAELAAGAGADEIVAWHRHLRKVLAASHREDLWAAAYLINGGCSDDGFDSFRGWLVAQGRETVARAVREPDALAELPAVRAAADTGAELACEELLDVAAQAHRQVTGVELPASADPVAAVDTGNFWDFDDEDEMRRRLPGLSALFLAPPEE